MGENTGTGFLIAPQLLVTARHVVAEVNDDQLRQRSELELFYGGSRGPSDQPDEWLETLDVVACDPMADWIVLRVDGLPGQHVWPLAIAREVDSGREWSTFGFHSEDGDEASGTLETVDAPRTKDTRGERRRLPSLQLFSKQAAAGDGQPKRGYSGGPVVIDGHVVGVLVAAARSKQMSEPSDSQPSTVRGGTVYARPIEPIAEALDLPLGDLSAAEVEMHLRSARWRVVLRGEFEDLDEATHAKLLDALQSLPYGCELTITRILAGSIVVELSGTKVALYALQEDFNSGRLTRLAGFEVLAVEPVTASIEQAVAQPNTLRIRQIEQRRAWLASAIVRFSSSRPAARLLRRVPAAQRSLSKLYLPLELCAYEQYGQIGASRYSLLEVFAQTHGPLLLIAERGAGKTTALEALGWELARRTDETATTAVPVHELARRLATKRRHTAVPLTITDIVGSAAVEPVSLVLLVDGLDELGDDLMQVGEQCIRELAEAPFVERIIVTSRPVSGLPSFGFKRFSLLPWSRTRVDQFARAWGGHAPPKLWKLSGGSPLWVTLACAYPDEAAIGLIELLARVAVDVRAAWLEHIVNQSAPSFKFEAVEDACLWILFGTAGMTQATSADGLAFQASLGTVLDFLEREGLIYPGNEFVVFAGARPILEYLAACACVRRPAWLDKLVGKLELGELVTMALALELAQESEHAVKRLQRLLSRDWGLGPFRLRAALIAARACALRGDRLPSGLAATSVNCLWRYVTGENSHWKSERATEALAALCAANADAAALVSPRIAAVLSLDGADATEELATHHGLLHIHGQVRIAALKRCTIEPLEERARWLQRQLYDESHFPNPGAVAIAAGLHLRALERSPELAPILAELVRGLGQHQVLSAATAAALHPGEAELIPHAIGLQHLVELGQCPDELRLEFLAYPGGREAARQAHASSLLRDPERSIEAGGLILPPPQPVPRYSFMVQRACWQLLVPALRGKPIELSHIARQQARNGDQAALAALIGGAVHDPNALTDVLKHARPWSLQVEDEASAEMLKTLVEMHEAIRNAFVEYVTRSNEAHYVGRVPPLRVLEPLLERDDIRRIFIASLSGAWSSPAGNYRLPLRLLAYPDVAATARDFAKHLIDQVEARTERKLWPPAAATPLVNAGWLYWEELDTIVATLQDWLTRGGGYARLVGLMLENTPSKVFDALIPALETYLDQPGDDQDFEDSDTRRLIISALPSSLRFRAQYLDLPGAHSLVGAAKLCELLPPAEAHAVSARAAEQRLFYASFPHENARAHLRTLVKWAPDEWFAVLLTVHPLQLRWTIDIAEALFEILPSEARKSMSFVQWARLGDWWTPYRQQEHLSMLGQRPADVAEEWLFRFADECSPASIPSRALSS